MSLVASLLARRTIFCGGKGGVGKTTVATALALLAAERGLRVLLVSTDPAHSLGDLLGRPLDDAPVAVAPGLSALEVDPAVAVARYIEVVGRQLRDYVRPDLYPEVDRQLAQAREAPGAQEAALLERVAGLLVTPPGDPDLLVVDTAPTGHTLRLLSLPETMAAWTAGLLAGHSRSESLQRSFRSLLPGGADTERDQRRARLAATLEARRQLFATARDRLRDATRTAFLMVLTPDRLPLEETDRALGSLAAAGIPVAGLIVNQVLPAMAEGDFLAARRAVQAGYLAEIDQRFAAFPRLRLPLLAREAGRDGGLEELVALLARESG